MNYFEGLLQADQKQRQAEQDLIALERSLEPVPVCGQCQWAEQQGERTLCRKKLYRDWEYNLMQMSEIHSDDAVCHLYSEIFPF